MGLISALWYSRGLLSIFKNLTGPLKALCLQSLIEIVILIFSTFRDISGDQTHQDDEQGGGLGQLCGVGWHWSHQCPYEH